MMTVTQVTRTIPGLEDEGGGRQVLNIDVAVDLNCLQSLMI